MQKIMGVMVLFMFKLKINTIIIHYTAFVNL